MASGKVLMLVIIFALLVGIIQCTIGDFSPLFNKQDKNTSNVDCEKLRNVTAFPENCDSRLDIVINNQSTNESAAGNVESFENSGEKGKIDEVPDVGALGEGEADEADEADEFVRERREREGEKRKEGEGWRVEGAEGGRLRTGPKQEEEDSNIILGYNIERDANDENSYYGTFVEVSPRNSTWPSTKYQEKGGSERRNGTEVTPVQKRVVSENYEAAKGENSVVATGDNKGEVIKVRQVSSNDTLPPEEIQPEFSSAERKSSKRGRMPPQVVAAPVFKDPTVRGSRHTDAKRTHKVADLLVSAILDEADVVGLRSELGLCKDRKTVCTDRANTTDPILKDVMHCVNHLVRDQLSCRCCLTLPPELYSFLHWILHGKSTIVCCLPGPSRPPCIYDYMFHEDYHRTHECDPPFQEPMALKVIKITPGVAESSGKNRPPTKVAPYAEESDRRYRSAEGEADSPCRRDVADDEYDRNVRDYISDLLRFSGDPGKGDAPLADSWKCDGDLHRGMYTRPPKNEL